MTPDMYPFTQQENVNSNDATDQKDALTHALPPIMPTTTPLQSNLINLLTEETDNELLTDTNSSTETALVLHERPTSFEQSEHDLLIDFTEVDCSKADLNLEIIPYAEIDPCSIPLPDSPPPTNHSSDQLISNYEPRDEIEDIDDYEFENKNGDEDEEEEEDIDDFVPMPTLKHSEIFNVVTEDVKTQPSSKKPSTSFMQKCKKIFSRLLGDSKKHEKEKKKEKAEEKAKEKAKEENRLKETTENFRNGPKAINTNFTKPESVSERRRETLTPIFLSNASNILEIPHAKDINIKLPEIGSDAYEIMRLCNQSFFG